MGLDDTLMFTGEPYGNHSGVGQSPKSRLYLHTVNLKHAMLVYCDLSIFVSDLTISPTQKSFDYLAITH